MEVIIKFHQINDDIVKKIQKGENATTIENFYPGGNYLIEHLQRLYDDRKTVAVSVGLAGIAWKYFNHVGFFIQIKWRNRKKVDSVTGTQIHQAFVDEEVRENDGILVSTLFYEHSRINILLFKEKRLLK
jgi:hypothetical protein